MLSTTTKEKRMSRNRTRILRLSQIRVKIACIDVWGCPVPHRWKGREGAAYQDGGRRR
jgi:hypothetical protein